MSDPIFGGPSGLTLANKITITRIVAIPVFVVLMITDTPRWIPVTLFTLTVLTDALDGFIARTRKQQTELGRFLDPLADKLLLIAAMLVLALHHMIPFWVWVVVLSRDIIIALGWTLIYILKGSATVEPSWQGKVTTVCQMTFALAALVAAPASWLLPLQNIMIAATIVSGVDYVIVGSRRLTTGT